VKELNRLEGHQYITSGKTVMNWHHAFRNHNESFINPRFDYHGKVKLPPLLERNPDFKMAFLQHATSNLNDLSTELLLAYLHETALPALLEEFREKLEFQSTQCLSCYRNNDLPNFQCQQSTNGCGSWVLSMRSVASEVLLCRLS
jgi:hypothetical protein